MTTASSITKINLLLVDDHPVVRMGLSTMLQQHEQMVVVAAVDSGESAIQQISNTDIDIVLLDLRMPGMSGIETLRNMRRIMPKLKVIILSSFELDEEIYQAVVAGAHGYLMKDVSSGEILEAIHRVHEGLTYFPKRIADRLDDRRLRPNLSKREIEILELVCKGLTNKEIGNTLQLSQFTVRNHLNNITSKLEATDRTEAAFIAIQTGIVAVSH